MLGSDPSDADSAAGQADRLAEEQAALRRVATLVARQSSEAEVFTAVAHELGRVLGVDAIHVVRFDRAGDTVMSEVVASWGGPSESLAVGATVPLGGENLATLIFHRGRSARRDEYPTASGPVADAARRSGIRSAVGAPVHVGGRLWGVMIASARDEEPLPRDTEQRLGQFTELMGTAIANAAARAEVRRLADEQAALRRVATLVAKGAASSEIFAAVIGEARVLLDGSQSGLMRFENDREARILAVETEGPAYTDPGMILPLQGESVIIRVFKTGRPARIDHLTEGAGPTSDIVRRNNTGAAIGAPITVERRTWGALVVAWEPGHEPPADAEEQLAEFAKLLATALANTEARAEVQRLADEQAALRRVATLVAKGAAPRDVFGAAVSEALGMLDAEHVALGRYEDSGELTVLAADGNLRPALRVGIRVAVAADSLTAQVRATERPARFDLREHGAGETVEIGRRAGADLSIGAPVRVEGRLWGLIAAGCSQDKPPAAGAEDRLAEFAELLATAIANADTRDKLTASRARVLSAGDEARRRVVRDLHDGAQQHLVHAIVTLKLAQRATDMEDEEAGTLLAEALDHVERGNAELRELAHGMLPSVLTGGGLRAGIHALVSRLDLPVEVDVTDERLPPEIEASAYFVAAEGLTNVVKHANAARARVDASVAAGTLCLQVSDDGDGGADAEGHGLIGLADRVAAFGGRLRIETPPEGGTVLTAQLPLPM